ncbi:MAG: NVEALA domain-containing protein [Dysgonomonas sp.]
MKKKIIGGIVVFIIATVTVFNLNMSNSHDLDSTTLRLINIEALAESESSGSRPWNCSTYTSDTHTESFYCDGRYTKRVSVATRECNNGLLSWCYPGYISTYYDCYGNVSSTLDMTNISGCS